MTFALSIQQPWAELILLGRKTIELRTWTTDYRGKLWVHTGQKINADLDRHFALGEAFRGGYVGVVTLEHVYSMDHDKWVRWHAQHLDPGPYQQGFFGWVLTNPVRFVDPVPAPGRLNLFSPLPEVEAQLFTQERLATRP